MFEKGEKTENGEGLSRKRARQVGENVEGAVNAGVGESPEELAENFEYVSSDSFGPDLGILRETEAAKTTMELFSDDPKMQEKIRRKLEEKQARRTQEQVWDNYVGAALAAKENEIGSMVSDEERIAEQRMAEASEVKNGIFSPEWRAEKVERLMEEVRGNKAFLKMRRRLVSAIIPMALPLFLAACGDGDTTVREVHAVSGNESFRGMNDRDDNEEEVIPEVVEEEVSEEINEARSLEEILALSEGMDYSKLTQEDLRIAGYDADREQEFQEKEDARVLENGTQLSFEDYYSSEKTAGKYSFGPSDDWIYDLKENRTETYIDNLLDKVWTQPLALASSVTNLPTIMRAAGISEDIINIENPAERAQAVADAMIQGEDGGDLQQRLRGAYRIALMNDKTTYDFYLENGAQNTFYFLPTDPSTQENPETNLKIALQKGKKRRNEKEVLITFNFADGHQETSAKHLSCGEQDDFEVVTVKTASGPIEVYIPKNPIKDSTVYIVPNSTPEPKPSEPSSTPESIPEDSQPDSDKSEESEPEEPETPPDSKPDTPENPPVTPPEDPPVIPPEDPPVPVLDKQKDAEGQKKVVNEGIQSNPVDQTANVDDLSNQGIVQPSNGVYVDGGDSEQGSEGQSGGVQENQGDQSKGSQGNTQDNRVPLDKVTGDLTGTYEQTEESVIDDGNKERVEEGQVVVPVEGGDELSDEEKAAIEAEQEAANEQEIIDNMSDAEFIKYLEDLMKDMQ